MLSWGHFVMACFHRDSQSQSCVFKLPRLDLQRLVKELFGPRVMGEPVFGQAAIKKTRARNSGVSTGADTGSCSKLDASEILPWVRSTSALRRRNFQYHLELVLFSNCAKTAVRRGRGLAADRPAAGAGSLDEKPNQGPTQGVERTPPAAAGVKELCSHKEAILSPDTRTSPQPYCKREEWREGIYARTDLPYSLTGIRLLHWWRRGQPHMTFHGAAQHDAQHGRCSGSRW